MKAKFLKFLSIVVNKSVILTKVRLAYEVFVEYKYLTKFLGVFSTNNDTEKLKSKIRVISHSIEKGLSLPNPRIGFGENKVLELLELLNILYKNNDEYMFVSENISIIKKYIDFNRANNYKNPEVIYKYEVLNNRESFQEIESGTKNILKGSIDLNMRIKYTDFIHARHSIRDFSDIPVPIEEINCALEIAENSPSACNRQPWCVYVFANETKKNQLLDWQGGSKGFSNNISVAILITCSLKNYFVGENHQAFIDGGIYSMNLILALHALGLGTIPLTLGLPSNKLKYLHNKFEICKYHVPILIIGVGNIKDEFKVAVSHRSDFKEYTKYIL